MKPSCWITPLVLAIFMAGCASQTPAVPSPTSVPAAPSNSTITASGNVAASATVQPAMSSQMGFLISAAVKEVNVKEGNKVRTGQTLIVLNTPELSLSVTAAQAAVRAAQAEVELRKFPHKTLNKSFKIIYLSGPPELDQVANARLEQAQAALEAAQAALAQGTLLAPYDGTVVKLNVFPGELVQPGQVVAVIGDLDHLQIETTDLSEREIAGVKIGQTATVHVKALNQDFNGKVGAIAPIAEKNGGDLVYKVVIELDTQPPSLMWGMSADVEIQTGK